MQFVGAMREVSVLHETLSQMQPPKILLEEDMLREREAERERERERVKDGGVNLSVFDESSTNSD